MQKDISRKKRWRMWLMNTLAVGGALVLFTLLGFVHKKQQNNKCWQLDVKIDAPEGSQYIDAKMIRQMVTEAADDILGANIESINLEAIHQKVAGHSCVKEANVYTTVDGRCVVHVKQRSPIARIFNSSGISYYLDADGYTMGLSPLHTARVPVFTGHISAGMQPHSVCSADSIHQPNQILKDVYTFTQYISGNEFWKAQVEHVYVNEYGEFVIIPRVGNHEINMGRVENLDEKFRKLMAFYAHTVHTKDLNQYTEIKVQYDGQIVCVRK